MGEHFQKDDLVGKVLHGWYQRNPPPRNSRFYMNQLAELKQQYPEDYKSQVYERKMLTRKAVFRMQLFDYDPKTGLFLAKGKDKLGDSAIAGRIYGAGIEISNIQFWKIYSSAKQDENDNKTLHRMSPPNWFYEGQIHTTADCNAITALGDFRRILSSNPEGRWLLTQKP